MLDHEQSLLVHEQSLLDHEQPLLGAAVALSAVAEEPAFPFYPRAVL
jgi:hypothetical protein